MKLLPHFLLISQTFCNSNNQSQLNTKQLCFRNKTKEEKKKNHTRQHYQVTRSCTSCGSETSPLPLHLSICPYNPSCSVVFELFFRSSPVRPPHWRRSQTSLGFHMVIILSRALLTNENGLCRLKRK